MFDDRAWRLLVGGLACAGVAFLLLPVLVTVVASFEASSFIAFPPTSLSWKWYREIGAINRIGEAAWISLQVALASAAIATALACAAAIALVRGGLPGAGPIAQFLASPLSLPMVAIGMALIQAFIHAGIAFTWSSLVIGHVVLVIAYPLRTLVAALATANRSIEEAAASLGAPPLDVFRTITLVQIAPGLVSGFLFAFLISFDNYPISLFLVRGGLTTMPIELFNYMNQNLDPTPAALSTVYILVVSLLIAAAERRFGIISLGLSR